MMPAAPPMTIADMGPTYPEPGVIATRPATAPLAAPSMVGFPRTDHSANNQLSDADAAAVFVATNALVANPLAPSADPALNPNHPTHNRPAPITVNGTLCGGIGSVPCPRRLPIINTATKAEIPEL